MLRVFNISTARKWIYGILCVFLAFAFMLKCMFWHRVYQYRTGKEQLEMDFGKDNRFHDVRVLFFETRPSVSILAPQNLRSDARSDLERLVAKAFGGLPVTLSYPAEEGSDNDGGGSGKVDRQAVTNEIR